MLLEPRKRFAVILRKAKQVQFRLFYLIKGRPTLLSRPSKQGATLLQATMYRLIVATAKSTYCWWCETVIAMSAIFPGWETI